MLISDFIKYVKYRMNYIIMTITIFVMFAVSFMLYHLPIKAVVYPFVLCVAIGIVVMAVDFYRVVKQSGALRKINVVTEELLELFPSKRDVLEEEYYNALSRLLEVNRYMENEANKKYNDMISYYTLWAHQIKTPIASMRLNLQNEDTPFARKISVDLFRIEQYVEMVLTFLRLDSDYTDYVITDCDLDCIIKSAVKKYRQEFIGRKLALNYEPVNLNVITDEKWLSFVIEQVLSNALKYTKTGSITISVNDNTLCIEDTGIGIAPEDIPRIFEKGYTGYQGRTHKKASGIGLSLCKEICDRLNHKISVESEPDIGTKVYITMSNKRLETE